MQCYLVCSIIFNGNLASLVTVMYHFLMKKEFSMSNLATIAFVKKFSGTLGAPSVINKPKATLKKYKLEPESLSNTIATNISNANSGSGNSSAGGAAGACA